MAIIYGNYIWDSMPAPCPAPQGPLARGGVGGVEVGFRIWAEGSTNKTPHFFVRGLLMRHNATLQTHLYTLLGGALRDF
jgi:hypothetical protein